MMDKEYAKKEIERLECYIPTLEKRIQELQKELKEQRKRLKDIKILYWF